MSNICVIGTGYVGLVAIASFAELGHRVTGLDIDERKIKMLREGQVPFHEPGLEELLSKKDNKSRVRFTTEYAEAVKGQDFVFICVNTPPTRRGKPRMNQITAAARALARNLDGDTIIVNKSTGPVGMADLIARILAEHPPRRAAAGRRPVIANPEFLSQGRAVHDFLNPHQVVIGSYDRAAAEALAGLYEPLEAPIAMVEPRAAEMTKLVSNAFRAMKVSFTNEVSAICEQLEVDVTQVTRLLSSDKAIGHWFLSAGVGWGGNCLPKDVLTLEHVAKVNGVRPRMLHAAIAVNQAQRQALVLKARRMVGDLAGKRMGVLGLAFKGGTDDIRESPAVAVVRQLAAEGARVAVHDPMAMENARRVLGDGVTYCADPYEVAANADVLFLLTDCPEYRPLDLGALALLTRHANLVDGRNFFDAARAKDAGFTYVGVGRGYPRDGKGPVPTVKDGVADLQGAKV